jgi:hypothetical protein
MKAPVATSLGLPCDRGWVWVALSSKLEPMCQSCFDNGEIVRFLYCDISAMTLVRKHHNQHLFLLAIKGPTRIQPETERTLAFMAYWSRVHNRNRDRGGEPIRLALGRCKRIISFSGAPRPLAHPANGMMTISTCSPMAKLSAASSTPKPRQGIAVDVDAARVDAHERHLWVVRGGCWGSRFWPGGHCFLADPPPTLSPAGAQQLITSSG